MEVLLIEIHRRNKNATYLLAIPYQPCSSEPYKFLWLDSLESLLSEVTTKWSGVIFVTGNTNIDPIDLICKALQNILHSSDLQQHITMANRIFTTNSNTLT